MRDCFSQRIKVHVLDSCRFRYLTESVEQDLGVDRLAGDGNKDEIFGTENRVANKEKSSDERTRIQGVERGNQGGLMLSCQGTSARWLSRHSISRQSSGMPVSSTSSETLSVYRH